jgi:hypothetical protein
MGGNKFKNVVKPIHKDDIEPTLKEYKKELRKLFGTEALLNLRARSLGSVGKKEYSGDIDLGIEYRSNFLFVCLEYIGITEDVYKTQFDKYKKRSRTATHEQLSTKTAFYFLTKYINENSELMTCDEKVVPNNMFTTFPQYGTDGKPNGKYVQIDLMFGNLEWLKFSYYSENLTGNIKGLHRTQLIVAMLAHKGYTFNHNTGVKNKETNEVVCTTPKEILKLLQTEYTDFITEEKIYDFSKLFTTLFTFYDKTTEVADIYLKILDSTRCDIPDVLHEYWKEHQERLGLKGKFLPEDSKLYKYKVVEV